MHVDDDHDDDDGGGACGGRDDDDDDDDDRDDGYGETYYSSDFENDDEDISSHKDDNETSEIDFRTIHLKHGFRLLVPYDAADVCDCPCKVELLSAERRTDLLSEYKHISDDIVISDAYEVTDPGINFTHSRSRSKLQFPLVLPTTRLNHADLFRFHVMARERNGDWKKVPAHYQNSELTFPLNGVKSFVAYAQPIPEFTNVTSSGLTFKSVKSEKISVEIPEGAVDGEIMMQLKVHPVDMDRMNAYEAFDPGSINCIYALTDILYVRHTMDNVLQREGSVRLPIETVDKDHDIICFITTSGKCKIVKVDKEQFFNNGQVKLPYKGDPKTSYQVACVRRGANNDKIRHDAAYLSGQADSSCTILFFIWKHGEDRYLTVDVVGRALEESVYENRRDVYEIKNSRLSGVKLGEKRRIRVDLGGNMQSAERTKDTQFTFVYNSRCKNNSIFFRTAMNCHGLHYSIVKVLFDDKKVHEIHFNYPCVGKKLEEIKNIFVSTALQRCQRNRRSQRNHLKGASILDSGFHTERTWFSKSDVSPSEQKIKKEPEIDLELVVKPKPSEESDLETKPEPESKPELKSKPEIDRKQEPKPKQEPDVWPEQKLGLKSKSDQEREYNMTMRWNRSSPPVAHIPLSDQSSTTTDFSSVPETVHPLLREDSLLILGMNMLPEDVNNLMILAGIKSDKIKRIRREANGFEGNFILFKEWRTKKKSVLNLSDKSTLRSLEDHLKEIGRADIAQIVKRLRKRRPPRRFKDKDFEN